MRITPEKKLLIFNRISLIIAIISLSLGMLVARVIGSGCMLYFEAFVTAAFFLVPLLPSKVGFNIKVALFFIILDIALMYYGVVLGPVAFIPVVIPFLFGAAGLFISSPVARISCWGFIVLALCFLEVNYVMNWISPMVIPYKNQILVREVVFISAGILSSAVIYFYKHEWISEKIGVLIEQLEQADLSKNIYIRETTHELRTPLASISGIAYLLYDQIESLKKQHNGQQLADQIESLYQSTLITNEIINNILDLSKLEAGKMNQTSQQTLNLRAVIQHAVQMGHYMGINKKLDINFNYDQDLPDQIVSDKNALHKILNNLISNAVKYAPVEGSINITAQKQSGLLVVEVTNTGEISEERMVSIFDLYTSYHSPNNYMNSSGLGLPICKHMVELLGGHIEIKRETDLIILRVELPLLSAPVAERPVDQGLLHGYKVLCVEDDLVFSSLLKSFLNLGGAEALLCKNVEEALTLLKGTVVPDAILTDINLPGMSGKDFIALVKDDLKLQHIPILMITGDAYSDQGFADDYLLKPFTYQNMESVLIKHLRGRPD